MHDAEGPADVEESSIAPALKAAFGRRAKPAAPSHPSVLLREIPGEQSPLVRVPAAGAPGLPAVGPRYQLLGEIARGGIGVVLKGRDASLGRDVAVKVLREEHAGDADVVFRFIEEAQIGGQLQHPGIVPVYDLGTNAENRPFFAMKLVKGRTLSATLADRKASAAERRRLLSVFEAVCRTVAFAHAHGVIHRDLKPSNVMIGAFGEVQVVDWGLAKVLGQDGADTALARRPKVEPRSVITTVRSGSAGSNSLVGSVMGTPAYMSPEQARGETETLDERSDVFALGAILCEILTGRPPYVGTDSEVARQCSRGEVGDAVRRLAECGAHASLVDLCRSSLAPQKSERPKDAGAVADGVAAYLAAVEKRVEQSRVEAAKARVRSDGDRRARRLVAWIAACVLVAVVAGGGAVAWLRQSSAARAATSRREADQALAEATLLRGRASAAGDARGLADARAAGRRAAELAASLEKADPLRIATERLLKDVDADESKVRAVADRKASDATTSARLESLRLDDAAQHDAPRLAKRIAETFVEYGIDVDSLGPEEAARRIKESAIRTDLVDALDAWAGWTEKSRGRARSAIETAKAADPDPWRDALRSARGVEEVNACVDSFDAEKQTASAAVLLALRVDDAGDRAGTPAEKILWKTFLFHPDDYWVNVTRARLLLDRRDPDRRIAMCHLVAAAAVASDSADALALVSSLETQARDPVAAAATAREALAITQTSASAQAALGDALDESGDAAGALKAHREAARLAPENVDHLRRLAESLARTKEWASAERTAADAVAKAKDSAAAHRALATALLGKGESDRAIDEAKQAVALDEHDARALLVLGRAYEAKGADVDAEAKWTDAVAVDPDFADAYRALAAFYERKGDVAGAEKQLWQLTRIRPDELVSHVALASASRRSGSAARAAEEVEEALRIDDRCPAAYAERARCRYALGAFEDAVADAKRAADLASSDVATRRLLVRALVAAGHDEEAIAAQREVVRLAAGDAWENVRLARMLESAGRFGDAAIAAREAQAGRDAGAAAEGARVADRCDALGRVDAQLGEVSTGKRAPRDAAEALLFARLCVRRGRCARAAELFATALVGRPATDAEEQWDRLYDAACASAGAGTFRGKDELEPPVRESRRKEALERLRAILAEWTKRADDPDVGPPPRLAERLEWWKRDPLLACVRGPRELACIPERDDWRQFWKDVDLKIDQAGERP
jgi:serine/threonine-protein kinase